MRNANKLNEKSRGPFMVAMAEVVANGLPGVLKREGDTLTPLRPDWTNGVSDYVLAEKAVKYTCKAGIRNNLRVAAEMAGVRLVLRNAASEDLSLRKRIERLERRQASIVTALAELGEISDILPEDGEKAVHRAMAIVADLQFEEVENGRA